MNPLEEAAIEAAVRAVRRYEADGWVHGRDSAVDALEDALGPLDWSFGGRGYRLLRKVAERAFGPDYGRRTERERPIGPRRRALALYDRYSADRIRFSGRVG